MASTVTATVTASITSTVTRTVASAAASSAAAVPDQAGILEGNNPVVYNPSNPVVLFIVQAGIVIIFCQLLHFPLRWLHQPRVIAEVIGGIILGPSVMMRIPGFKDSIFPTASMPVFNNVANLGLIFFLFLVALEVDIRLFVMNWRIALSVGMAGMLLPFGLGFSIAWGLYNQFNDDTVRISFGVYGLFIGTALAITAFPVLCRILTELKLLRSGVGVTVLAAGVSNDVIGWILLALCVALVNNNSGLAALWVLLTCVAWVLFLVYAVRPVFINILRRTGSLQNGPSQLVVALTMLLVLTSAWFTAIIGIHAIFGAFLVGMICPHDGGFAIKLTEKIEDLVSVIFLPLYFALSGLSTDLGLLDDGITWAYVIGVLACAFAGKIIGGTLAAKAHKLLWRESLTIGCLMSCKGLVELIVLNIGLQAKILSQRTFTMFVVMALITTVSTTPLVKALYPPWYREKVDKWRRGEIDWDGNPLDPLGPTGGNNNNLGEKLGNTQFRRILVYLRLDCLPSLFTLVSLLGHSQEVDTPHSTATSDIKSAAGAQGPPKKRPMEVHGLRMVELTDRTSSVMHVTEGEEVYSLRDPVVNAFKAFSQLHDLAASGRAVVVPSDSYAETLLSQAADLAADFALIPWSEYGSVTEDLSVPVAAAAGERFRSTMQLDFVQAALARAGDTCNAGVFISNGFGGLGYKPTERPHLLRTRSAASVLSSHGMMIMAAADAAPPLPLKGHHIFLPFFGGADDRLALRLVLQLAHNPSVTATVAHMRWPLDAGGLLPSSSQFMEMQSEGDIVGATTVRQSDEKDPAQQQQQQQQQQQRWYSRGNAFKKTATATATATACDATASRSHHPEDDSDAALLDMLQSSLATDVLARVRFEDASGEAPATIGAALAEMLSRARAAVGRSPSSYYSPSSSLGANSNGSKNNAGDVVICGRRHGARLSGEATPGSASSSMSDMTLQKTIGTVAEQLVSKGVKASILVVQAAGRI